MTVALRSLRVSAEMNSSDYVAGAKALETASTSAGAAVKGLGATVQQTDTKISVSGNGIHRLSMQYLDGYSNQVKFEQGLRRINVALETGQIGLTQAQALITGMTQKLAYAGNAAELAAQGHTQLAGVVSNVNRTLDVETGQIDLNTAALVRNAAASKASAAANDNAARYRRGNLTYQLFDVGQMAALGQNPMLTLMQQGPQIAQIYAGNGGVNAAFKDLGSILGTVATRFGPIAIAAGLAAAGIGMLTSEIGDATGVAVNFGDVLKAVIQVPADAIYTLLQPAIAAISPWFDTAWDLAIKGVKFFVNNTIASMGVMGATIKLAANSIGPLFTAAGEAAANGFISGINWMVEKSLAGINEIIGAIKTFSEFVGADKAAEWFGFDLDIEKFDTSKFKVAPVDLDGVDTIAVLTKNWKEYQATVEAIVGKDYAGQIFKAIAGQAADNARDRIANTEEALKKAKEAAAELKRQFDAFEGRADNLLEQYLPGEAARREAHELMSLLSRFGDQLDEFQRKAVETRIDEQFIAAALGMRDLGSETDRTKNKVGELAGKAKELTDTLKEGFSGLLQDLFTGRDLMESLVQLGSRFASINFDALVDGLSGAFGGGAPASGFPSAPKRADMVSFAKVIGLEIGKAVVPAIEGGGPGPDWERTGRSGTYASARVTGATMAQGVTPVLSKALDPIGVVITKAAQQLGISARDLATVISYETGGTMSPSIMGGAGGRHMGLIQFGPSEAKKYGAIMGQSFGEQMPAVVSYLQDRGLMPGMGLMDLYSTINAGRPGLYNRSDAANGGATGTVADKVLTQMAGHQARADQILAGVPDAVKTGATAGTAKGAETGILRVGNMAAATPGKSAGGFDMFAGLLGAGLGGFSTGYQSQSPGMGALGGGLQGLGAGMQLAQLFPAMGMALPIIGVAIGAAAGLLGGIFGAKDKLKRAQKELEKQMKAIDALLAVGEGRGVGPVQKRLMDYLTEIDKAVDLAWKARNMKLVDRLQQSFNTYWIREAKDFENEFEGMLDAYRSGRGEDDPYIKGADAVGKMREGVRSLIADVRYFGESRLELTPDTPEKAEERAAIMERTANEIEAVTAAARSMALSFIMGADELTEFEQAVLSLDGAADSLQVVLVELGMEAETAAKAIREQLNAALKQLQSDYIEDVSRSLYDLSDLGYFNDLLDAQDRYNDRLRDAAALGLSADLANRELALSLRSIAKEAELTDEQIKQLAAAFPGLSSSLMGLLGLNAEGADTGKALADAQAKVEEAKAALRSAYEKERSEIESTISRLKNFTDSIKTFRDSLRLDKELSPLDALERLMEAERQFNQVSAAAMGSGPAAEAAQGRLEEVSRAYLEEARSYYGSNEQYAAIWQRVDTTLDQALAKASSQLSNAEKQLKTLEKTVGALIDIDDGVKSVSQAMADLKTAQDAEAAAQKADDAYKNNLFAEMLAVLKAQLAAQQAADAAAAAAAQAAQQASDAASKSSGYSSADPIANAYRTVLKREPDAEGYAFYAANLAAGRTTIAGIEADLKRYAPGMAEGGWVTGGVPGMDSVLRKLMPREFVMPAAAAQRHAPQLEAMRGGYYGPANDNQAALLAQLVQQVRALQDSNARLQERIAQILAAGFSQSVASTNRIGDEAAEGKRQQSFQARRKAA